MRILVVGATGTIGRAVVAALSAANEIVPVSRQSTAITVDLAERDSIRETSRSAGKLDAVVCSAGPAKFAPLVQVERCRFSLRSSS
jgi:nucleoside-diphosphate-sugar epimerase